MTNRANRHREKFGKQYVAFGKFLKQKRNLAGLSMRELAAKLVVSHSYIGKVESAERRLDFSEMMRYCDTLKIPDAELFEQLTAIRDMK